MKSESFRLTLCHRKGRLCFDISDSSQSLNATLGGLFWSLLLIFLNFHASACEKCGLGIILTDSFDDLSRNVPAATIGFSRQRTLRCRPLKDSTIGTAKTEACVFTDEGD